VGSRRRQRPWPFPQTRVRARESTTGAAVRWLRLVSVRRRASVRWGPRESGRCRRASGRSRQRPPRSGKGVRRSILHGDGRLGSRLTAAYLWRIESGVNCTSAPLKIKRSKGRRRAHILVARGLRTGAGENKFSLSGLPQEMHGSSTGFQQARHDPSAMRSIGGRRAVVTRYRLEDGDGTPRSDRSARVRGILPG
jgi:hypothetical protein